MKSVQRSLMSMLRERSARKYLAVAVCLVAIVTVFAVFWVLRISGLTLANGDAAGGQQVHTFLDADLAGMATATDGTGEGESTLEDVTAAQLLVGGTGLSLDDGSGIAVASEESGTMNGSDSGADGTEDSTDGGTNGTDGSSNSTEDGSNSITATSSSVAVLDASSSSDSTYYVADAVTLKDVVKTGAEDYIIYTVIDDEYYVLDANGRLRKANGLNGGLAISWAADDNLDYYEWNVTQATDDSGSEIEDAYVVENSTYGLYLSPDYSPVIGTCDDVTIEAAFAGNTGSVTLSGDFELTYTFKNTSNSYTWSETDASGRVTPYTNEYRNWFNYILEMYATDSNGTVYLDVRADNYGWLAYQDSSDTLIFGDGLSDVDGSGSTDDEWEDWLELMKAGAEVTVNIVKDGASISVTTTAAGATFTATAYVAEFEDAELTVYLTGQACTLENISYAYNYVTDENSEVSSYASGSDDDDKIEIGSYRAAFSDTLKISGDFVLNYSFTNMGDTTDESLNWNNYILEMHNSGGVYLDVRADNYGWISYGASVDTLTFGDGLSDVDSSGSTDDEWEEWLSVMTKGVTVNVQVERIGGYVTVTSIAGDYTFTATAYVSEYADGCELSICLTGEDCALADISYTYYTTASTRTSSSEQTAYIVLASSSSYTWTATATLSSNLRSGDYTMTAQVATGYIEWTNSSDNTDCLQCLNSSSPSTGITFYFATVRSFTVHFDGTNGGASYYNRYYGNNNGGGTSTINTAYTVTSYKMNADGGYFLVDASEVTVTNWARYYSYAADGWYDIYGNTYYDYDSSDLVYQFEYNANRNVTVCYADWVPASYDGGSSTDSYLVNGVDTSSFVTTKVYDYNDFFDLNSAYLDTSLTTLTASAHSELAAWNFTYLTNMDSDSNLILNNLGSAGLGVLFYTAAYGNSSPNSGLFAPYGRASLTLGGQVVNGNNTETDARTTGLTASASFGMGFDSEKLLNYLFDTEGEYGPYEASTGTGVMGKTYVGEGNYLYQYSSDTGYYYFDSAQNAAFYNQSAQRFYLYSYLVKVSRDSSTSDFLPFNYFNVGTVSAADQLISITESYVNYFFGMSSEIEFYLTDDTGTVDSSTTSGYGNQSTKETDMVFKFMGDDDVWVYIDYGTEDEQLVLDLGGIHDAVYGEINFSSGLVTVITNTNTLSGTTKTYVDDCVTTTSSIIGVDSTKVTYENEGSAGKIYYSGTSVQVGETTELATAIREGSHTLTIFYLERGASESNCAIYFNLSSETYNLNLSKWAEELGSATTSLAGAEFTYYTSTEFTDGNAASLENSSGVSQSTFEAGETAYSLRVGRTYYIKETAYPSGYTDGGRYLSVTMSRDGVLTVVVYSSGGAEIEKYTLEYDNGLVTWTDSSSAVWDSAVYDSAACDANGSSLCYMTYIPMTEGVAGYYNIGLIIQNTKAYEIPTTGSVGILPYRNVGFSLVLVAITGLMITAFYHLVRERKLRANENKKEYP